MTHPFRAAVEAEDFDAMVGALSPEAEVGSVADLTVFVRPMSGLKALAGAVAERLSSGPGPADRP